MRGHDWINNSLPDELIVEIFSHLHSKPNRDACSLVCRRWFRLERRTRTTLRIGATHLFLDLLPTRFASLTNLYIDERLSIPLHLVRLSSLRSSPSILVFLFPFQFHCQIEFRCFFLFQGRRRATDEDGDLESVCLSDAGLSSLGEGFPKLRRLGLIWCSNVSSNGLASLAQKCTSLRALDLQVSSHKFLLLIPFPFHPPLMWISLYKCLINHLYLEACFPYECIVCLSVLSISTNLHAVFAVIVSEVFL